MSHAMLLTHRDIILSMSILCPYNFVRISVVFRDPREVVISEHRMRIEHYKKMDTSELNPFIYERFEVIIWIEKKGD